MSIETDLQFRSAPRVGAAFPPGTLCLLHKESSRHEQGEEHMALSRIQQFELQIQREIAQDRVEALLRQSPPALRNKIDWIRATIDDEWRRSIVNRYQVAVVIKDIYDDVTENKGSVYGAKAVEAIKKALGWDDGIIYQALHVADAFTPEQIEAMTQMRLPGGRPLTYSHVVELARVEDEGRREKLLRQAVTEGWTTRKLTNAVDLTTGPERNNPRERRGRPLARPKDFDGVLDQQAHFAEDFLNRNDQVWSHPDHSLSAKTQDLDAADFTRERAERLKRHADQMNRLAQKARERADEATRIHAWFEKVLEQQAARHKKLGLTATPGGPDAGPRPQDNRRQTETAPNCFQ
jgi:hypothetical protein